MFYWLCGGFGETGRGLRAGSGGCRSGLFAWWMLWSCCVMGKPASNDLRLCSYWLSLVCISPGRALQAGFRTGADGDGPGG